MSGNSQTVAADRREVAAIGIRLLDEAHDAWSVAQASCSETLHAWRDASPRQRAKAHAAFLAALDREEAAARDLERLARLTQEG